MPPDARRRLGSLVGPDLEAAFVESLVNAVVAVGEAEREPDENARPVLGAPRRAKRAEEADEKRRQARALCRERLREHLEHLAALLDHAGPQMCHRLCALLAHHNFRLYKLDVPESTRVRMRDLAALMASRAAASGRGEHGAAAVAVRPALEALAKPRVASQLDNMYKNRSKQHGIGFQRVGKQTLGEKHDLSIQEMALAVVDSRRDGRCCMRAFIRWKDRCVARKHACRVLVAFARLSESRRLGAAMRRLSNHAVFMRAVGAASRLCRRSGGAASRAGRELPPGVQPEWTGLFKAAPLPAPRRPPRQGRRMPWES